MSGWNDGPTVVDTPRSWNENPREGLAEFQEKKWNENPTNEENRSMHDTAGGDDPDRASGGGCRNCGAEGHFARECPEPKKLTGECFNCGEVGHNKADCTNARVARPFTGTCRLCEQEGHAARDCPTKAPDICKNCGQEGHKAATCENNRKIDNSHVPDHDATEAWSMLKKASNDRDMDDFKAAVAIYCKAQPHLTYSDLEKMFRDAGFTIYLVAVEKELPKSYTIVDLQGKSKCEFVVTYQFSLAPQRRKFAVGWPSSEEENKERLQNAGVPMEHSLPLCTNCDTLGHISKSCPEEKTVPEEAVDFKCPNCNAEGHRLRDCPEARVDRNACKNCKQSGHRAAECTEPRSAEGVECKRCNEVGHFAKDCPNSQGGGSNACRNCGQEGHMAKECDQPRNPATVQCRNCDEMGHFSRDCEKPKDWSRVKCNNCNQMGHTVKKCPQPIEDHNDNTAENDMEQPPAHSESVEGNWNNNTVATDDW